MPADSPRQPSQAYYAIAALMSVDYFVHPPANDGIELTVTSKTDHIATRWIFAHEVVDRIESLLRKDDDLRVSRSRWQQSGRTTT